MLVSQWLQADRSLARLIADGNQDDRNHYGEVYVRFLFSGPARAGLLHPATGAPTPARSGQATTPSTRPTWPTSPRSLPTRPLLGQASIDRIEQRLVQRRESLVAVDNQVGRIVAEVTERGQLASTYFIFMSDNGQMQGEHRIPRSKGYAYEPSARVPLVIAGRGSPQALATSASPACRTSFPPSWTSPASRCPQEPRSRTG